MGELVLEGPRFTHVFRPALCIKKFGFQTKITQEIEKSLSDRDFKLNRGEIISILREGGIQVPEFAEKGTAPLNHFSYSEVFGWSRIDRRWQD